MTTIKRTQLVMTSLSVEDPVALAEAVEMVALRIRHGQRDGVLTMRSTVDGSTTDFAWAVMEHEVGA